MAKLSNDIVKFSKGDTKPYEKFRDYYFHYMDVKAKKNLGVYDTSVDLSVKEADMQKVLLSEIERVAGFGVSSNIDGMHVAMNPMYKWATFAVVDMLIDSILPETIIDSIGVYTDIRNVGFGDSASFLIKPRTLFTVSQGANAERTAFVHKQFSTTKSLIPVNHAFTVQTALYKVLAGQESLAEFVRKAVISMETQMTKDAYSAFNAGLTAVTVPSALKIMGYTQDALLTLCQTVEAYNQGLKPVIVGTTKALSKVLPNAANGYRIVTNSETMGLQLIRNFFDYDILVLPQVATGNFSDFGLVLDDTRIYVVSPTSDKLVKGVIGGQTLTNANDPYDNADLTQNATINKRWIFEFMSNATAGSMSVA